MTIAKRRRTAGSHAEALWQIATYQGWQIQRLKIDDGCYELRGTDIQGRSFKAKIDPETLKVMKLKPEHHQRERQGWMQATAWRRSVAAVEPAALHAHVRGPDMAGSEGRLLRHESQSVLP